MKINKRLLIEIGIFALLWATYFAYGLWLRQQIPFYTPYLPEYNYAAEGEIHGFDYNGLGWLLSDYHRIPFTRFRHPLFGWMLAPVTLFGMKFSAISKIAYWGFLAAVFSAIVTLSIWLVWRIAHSLADGRSSTFRAVWAGLCATAFAAFGYMRYMAAGPESFPISMMFALATIAWALSERREKIFNHPLTATIRNSVWGVLFFLSGGMTITQGAKVVLAYCAVHRLSRQTIRRLVLSLILLITAGVLFYVIKLGMFGNGRTFSAAVAELMQFVPHDISFSQRLQMLEVFFFEPIIPHDTKYSVAKITCHYATIWPYLICAVIYILSAIGAWRLRHSLVLRIFCATFLVDAAIHLVLFWGMEEAQIYCGHWFYMLPLLMAAVVRKS